MIENLFARHTSRLRVAVPIALLTIGAIGCSSSSPTKPAPVAASVVVSPGHDTLAVGASVQLTAVALDADGALVPGVTFTWGPTGSAIVSVSSTGMVTATTAGGPVSVTATTSNSIVGTSSIVDTAANPITTVTITPTHDTLVVGASVQLTAVAKNAHGVVVPGVVFTWGPTASAVLSVSATGNVTALTPGGPVNVTATTPNNVIGTAPIVDTAANDPVASVKVVPAAVAVNVGSMAQLTDTVKDAAGTVLTGKVITWTSADTTKVKVSSSGQVTGIAAGGPIAVTASTGGKSGSSAVTVNSTSGSVVYATISAGFEHTCAVTTAGVAYCWGAGGQGQLGDASNQASYYKPIMVSGGQTWAVVRASGNYTCAITTGGTPYCWGTGPNLGDNSTTGHSSPVQLSGLSSADSITGGDGQACALHSGAAYCWGENDDGQIGINSTSLVVDSTAQAVQQGGLSFTAISAQGDAHVCALVASGAAYCWGNNSAGMLGIGSIGGEDSLPQAAATGIAFSQLATGGNQTCGIAKTGTTYCWGDNGFGELGDNSTTHSGTPVIVQGSHTFVQVVTNGSFSCGLTSAGAAWCWGNNESGQLGYNSTSPSSYVPVAVSGGLAFTTISAGGGHACGLVASGAAYCWGDNGEGQLGINSSTITNSLVPVAVAGP